MHLKANQTDYIKPNPSTEQAQRLSLFRKFYQEQEKKTSELAEKKTEITITLKNSEFRIKGQAYITTPLEIAQKMHPDELKHIIAARVVYVNDEGRKKEYPKPKLACFTHVYELTHRIEDSCELEFLKISEKVGKEILWKSSAHVLAEALENSYNIQLNYSPELHAGFCYDFFMDEHKIGPENFAEIETTVNQIIKSDEEIKKILVTKSQAMEIFKDNHFKLSYLQRKVGEDALVKVYSSGNLVNLCSGPHLPRTGRIGVFKLTKTKETNWQEEDKTEKLQRVYGASFPSLEELEEHIQLEKGITETDHRKIGQEQKLFRFTKYSPGSASFLPKGTIIYNKLIKFIQREYWARGFDEVKTPCINIESLWKTAGNFFKDKKTLFCLDADDGHFGMKPMNCPGHCAIFQFGQKREKDLPLRYGDFGVLHRNVHVGGLKTTRKFQQDDGHIFCTEGQVKSEIKAMLSFLKYVYKVLSLDFSLTLITEKPEDCMFEEKWKIVSKSMKEALDEEGYQYDVSKEVMAENGPMIGIVVHDCFRRNHQLGTIQLDFLLPERFNLQYRALGGPVFEEVLDKEEIEEKMKRFRENDMETLIKRAIQTHHNLDLDDIEEIQNDTLLNYKVSGKLRRGFKRPVLIHRTILGSLERCYSILTETYKGKWPFWLSPRQVKIIPVCEEFYEYSQRVTNRLMIEGFDVDVDLRNISMGKKVRKANLEEYNYVFVIGKNEVSSGKVSVRRRDENEVFGVLTFEEVIQMFRKEMPPVSDAWKILKDRSLYGKS